MPAGSASDKSRGGGVPITPPRTPIQEEEHTSSETTQTSADSPVGPAENGGSPPLPPVARRTPCVQYTRTWEIYLVPPLSTSSTSLAAH